MFKYLSKKERVRAQPVSKVPRLLYIDYYSK